MVFGVCMDDVTVCITVFIALPTLDDVGTSIAGFGDLNLTVNTDMATIVRAMAQPDSGLEIRDRMWLKITIPNAFIGKSENSAVIMENLLFFFLFSFFFINHVYLP